MHLLTWDCKAVRYEIPWLRPEWKYFRVDEEMPCENGATAQKGSSFRIPLILCSRFLVCISLSPQSFCSQGKRPARPMSGADGSLAILALDNHVRYGTASSVTGLMPQKPPTPRRILSLGHWWK